jgi:hypothetical protein
LPVNERDQPNTAAAIRYVKAAFGLESTGWRSTGSVPGSDHPKGLALDVPIAAGQRALGDRIAEWFLDHPDVFGVTYVIWRGRIRNPGGGWRPYSGPSRHDDHLHISLRAGGGSRMPAVGTPATVGAGVGENLAETVARPLVAGARKTVLLVAFTGLGLGLVALGGWRGVNQLRGAQ